MDKRKTPAGTNANEVRQQNAKSAGTAQASNQAGANQASNQAGANQASNQAGANQASNQAGANQASNQAGQYKAEFGSETDAQAVRQKNQKSQQKKGQNQK